jgi:hypothetical protein
MKSFKEFILEEVYKIRDPRNTSTRRKVTGSFMNPPPRGYRSYGPGLRGTATVDGNELTATDAYDIIHGSKGIDPYAVKGSGSSAAPPAPAGSTGSSTIPPPSPKSATQPSTSLGGNLIDKSYADGQSNRRISSTTGGVGMNTSSTLGKYSSSLRIY